METMNEKMARHRIVPVIKLNRADDALPLMEALVKGGLPVAEVTFRTEAAEASIRRIAGAFPDVLLGAGTVTSAEQVERAAAAGAQYVVTPGFSRPVTEHCAKRGLPLYPGVCTPSELMWLLEYGLAVAKFFPAAQYGGLATIKALAAPFPQMRFIPTGGVSEANLADYLAFPKVLACGGSWMVAEPLIAAGRFDEIEAMTGRAVKLAAG
ncbi:MAG: bifunctional 4-hydroxy-2-oxoglutarate aldolase/2-dehydro-3-deoxy-phosphogluconate aldolase [Oscillospiraceae bacterium]|jgi:2-dehydro-3-deoxyphosphogluconate aldolase/(4S)-4-hydroxy-2-oxoglutarate aldolase|nr:bifunctional 4-hydroxy-2-oxoglutarate aldolase/2-dehydro-3-deoxy-phosphogluconate aldolase [Oscillospiraceae bacterium]